MGDLTEAIKRRTSIRAYSARPVEDPVKEQVRGLLAAQHPSPFGNAVRLALVDLSDMEQSETRNLGTYGFISGARLFMAAIVRAAPGAMPDAGYRMEQAIVKITRLGLGTCWLGGTFKRAGFARKLGASDDDIIPAISPVGYARDQRTVRERIMRRFVGADQRKPWEELFFEESPARPLPREAAGGYSAALECLRLAPSASNMQPWRIVKSDASTFHFLLKRTPGYVRLLKAADLQMVDMGIAMANFELAARESGLDGSWSDSHPGIGGAETEYVISWVGK